MAAARTPKLVIDQAIKENRTPEQLCYGFAAAFVVTGLSVLGWGAWSSNPIVAASGTVATTFFYPALAAAKQIREDNMAIRLLEISLDKAATSEEAAKALSEAFSKLFVGRKVDK